MHIVLISTYGFDPHYPSRPEFVLARTLAHMGHTVSAIEYAHNPQMPATQQIAPNLTVYRCRTFGFYSYDLWRLSRRLPRPDIIHVHHLRHLLAYHAQRLWRHVSPMILTPHGMLHDGDLVVDRERPLEHPLTPEKLILNARQLWHTLLQRAHPRRSVRNYLIHAPLLGYNGILALSQHEKGVLVQLGIHADSIHVVPNAVEFDQYLNAPPRERRSTPMVLYIGQLVPRKGWDLAIRALPAIVAQRPDVQLVIVTHNTSQLTELQALAQELGVDAHVQVLTKVDEAHKVQLLQEAHVLIAPSRYEGFGIPPIEAMAAQCPVVTTDCAAGNEMVTHDVNGLLVAYNDVDGYAASVLRILADETLRTTLQSNGLAHVKSHYTPEIVAKQTLSYYEQYIQTFTN